MWVPRGEGDLWISGSGWFILPFGSLFLNRETRKLIFQPCNVSGCFRWYQFFQCLTFNAKNKTFNKHGHHHHQVDLQEEQEKRHMLLLLFGAQPWSYCPSAHHDQHSPEWHLSMQRNSNNLTCNFGCQNISGSPLHGSHDPPDVQMVHHPMKSGHVEYGIP